MTGESLQSRHAWLEETLAAVLDTLRALPDSPKTRELRGKAESYRHAMKRLGVVAPLRGAAGRDE